MGQHPETRKPNDMNYAQALKTLRFAKEIYVYVVYSNVGTFVKLDKTAIVKQFLEMDEEEFDGVEFNVRLVDDGTTALIG
jgi:hypothetical protein